MAFLSLPRKFYMRVQSDCTICCFAFSQHQKGRKEYNLEVAQSTLFISSCPDLVAGYKRDLENETDN